MNQSNLTQQIPFRVVLIANRGEIAIRLIRSVRRLGLKAVAVYVQNEAWSPHVFAANSAICLGSGPELYGNVEALLAAARTASADAVLPGYGFISEQAEAAKAIQLAGLIWIGPSPSTIQLFGLKHSARQAAESIPIPLVPGTSLIRSHSEAISAASLIGFPFLFKATAGGGGMGQVIVRNERELQRAYETVISQASSLFSNGDVYLERYVQNARHIEVQIFGDGKGTCVALGDRECSVQRRRQKVIEEGNAPNLSPEVRRQLRKAASALGAKHEYLSAGTVEFLVDATTKEWYFLEVNTRLQVEHGITELVSSIDIVNWMVLQAAGIDVLQGGSVHWEEAGCAIEARIYAENPTKDYTPCSGTLSEMRWPLETSCSKTASRIRVDAWADRGTKVSQHYDPLLGKILSWGKTRPLAVLALRDALRSTSVKGVSSNLELLLQTLRHPDFLSGCYTTAILNSIKPQTNALEILKPGVQSSLQDYPGRMGYWHVGVSPSGPMDAYAMGMANSLVGNCTNLTALEFTIIGPAIAFHCDAVIAITGGSPIPTFEDGRRVPKWAPVKVCKGSVLRLEQSADLGHPDTISRGGRISYLAIRGGFDVPKYLGSSSTFATGGFGGLTGSFLRTGDFLPVKKEECFALESMEADGLTFRWPLGRPLPSHFIPKYSETEYIVAALNGPHASVDLFREESLEEVWKASYTVQHATNRMGARLTGPKPKWARSDGGSAGLHPSNLHDFPYVPGAVNFSGDTPIVLMLDGPSLGGFLCPITVASADMWKVAQAFPGESICFKQVSPCDARGALSHTRSAWEAVRSYDLLRLEELTKVWSPGWVLSSETRDLPAVLARLDPSSGDKSGIKVTYRFSGEEHILVEFGDCEFDLSYRFRVHLLMESLRDRDFIVELSPGVRSLLIKYAPEEVNLTVLIENLKLLEIRCPQNVENIIVPSRKLELPLAFEDKWTIEAQRRYQWSVRSNAPYMPSNVEFVRRINGLGTVDDVKKIISGAEYMVLGLGDVYLGAPCAIPVDPRHRLVTSKYNPARTYTPEGAVGLGGAYMCIYGMDSPGGYQLIGRTLPIWDTYGRIPQESRGATRDTPWLLRFFDRVTFFVVSDGELEKLRSKYRKGDYNIRITEEEFSYRKHVQFCKEHEESIKSFNFGRKIAYELERGKWEENGELENDGADKVIGFDEATKLKAITQGSITEEDWPSRSIPIQANMSANVWAIHVSEGELVVKGQKLLSLESMKVEIEIESPYAGIVERISATKGTIVSPGTQLCFVRLSASEAKSRLTIQTLREQYESGIVCPSQVIKRSLEVAAKLNGVFTVLLSEDDLVSQIDILGRARAERDYMPLYGIPFTVSSDIDVEGYESVPGCSFHTYVAEKSSPLVDILKSAGALLVGKTSMDQMNIGYTGCESESACVENPAYPGYICGGNGSAAVAVMQQACCFSVLTDRNGSTIAAPALLDVAGIRTTMGLLPVSETCDSVSFFARNNKDLNCVLEASLESRKFYRDTLRAMPKGIVQPRPFGQLRLGIVNPEELTASSAIWTSLMIDRYQKAVDALERHGCSLLPVDIAPLEAAAKLCHEVPMNYFKVRSLQDVTKAAPKCLLPTVLDRIKCLNSASASTMGNGLVKLEEYKRVCDLSIWSKVDAVVFPAITFPCKKDIVCRDIPSACRLSSHYAQLVSCMDLCALTLSIRTICEHNEPAGVVVMSKPFQEGLLMEIGNLWESSHQSSIL